MIDVKSRSHLVSATACKTHSNHPIQTRTRQTNENGRIKQQNQQEKKEEQDTGKTTQKQNEFESWLATFLNQLLCRETGTQRQHVCHGLKGILSKSRHFACYQG